MILWVSSGLTSRCVSLAQAYYIVKTLRRGKRHEKLTVLWPKDRACGIGYYEVFDRDQFSDISVRIVNLEQKNIPEMLKEGKPGEIVSEVRNRLRYRRLKKRIEHKDYIEYYPDEKTGWSGDAYTCHLQKCWLKVQESLKEKKETFIHVFCGIINDEKVRHKVDLQTIKFQARFEKRAEEIIMPGKPWIGIHIRRTDHKIAMKKSKVEDFINIIQAEIKKDPSVKFFLATDDFEVQKKMKAIFGEKIVTQTDKIWGRDSEDGMETAVVDCLCLSKCDRIIGSYTSVFSAFSAEYGKKGLKICGL